MEATLPLIFQDIIPTVINYRLIKWIPFYIIKK